MKWIKYDIGEYRAMDSSRRVWRTERRFADEPWSVSVCQHVGRLHICGIERGEFTVCKRQFKRLRDARQRIVELAAIQYPGNMWEHEEWVIQGGKA